MALDYIVPQFSSFQGTKRKKVAEDSTNYLPAANCQPLKIASFTKNVSSFVEFLPHFVLMNFITNAVRGVYRNISLQGNIHVETRNTLNSSLEK